MITTTYEDTYACVATAKEQTKLLSTVVEFMSHQDSPVTCKEVGEALFGENYSHYYSRHSYASLLGSIFRHLHNGGFVTIEERASEPITIEVRKMITQDSAGVPMTITVHDDEGNTYQMPNPKANQFDSPRMGWGTVKKTIPTKIKLYKWVA